MREEQRARLVRCERHGLAYDPAKDEGCALCRGESRRPAGFPPLDRVTVGLLVAIVVMLAGGLLAHLATPLFERWLDSTAPAAAPRAASTAPTASAPAAVEPEVPHLPPPASDGVRSPIEPRPIRPELPEPGAAGALRSGTFVLRARNAAGRSGAIFVPAEAAQGPRPLLLLFHGGGASGAQILTTFSQVAKQRGLIVLAPDSGRAPAGIFDWHVPDRPTSVSLDTLHVKAALDELYATPHLAVDPERVLAAGFSNGGSQAAYLGTTDPRVRAFAVLHGGVFVGGLGTSQARGWFSTGSEDPVRPPAVVERAAAAARKHAGDVQLRTYPGGNGVSQAEVDDVMSWWLGR